MKFDKVLVTGGSGLLGRYVVAECARHAKVSVLDLAPPQQEAPFHRVDITDRDAVAAAMQGHDAVIHLAALDQAVVASEQRFFEINVMGVWNVLAAAEQAGVRRAVICSSVAAVALSRAFPPQYLPVDIAHPCQPTLAYGLSKQIAEAVGRSFARRGSMSVCALRPSWVVHPEIAYDIACKVATEDGGKAPPPATHPSWRDDYEALIPSRTFVTPDDAARAFRMALEAETGPFDAFFVTAKDEFSPLATVDVVRRSFGVDAEIRDPSLFDRDPRASLYDIGRARDMLGWEPQERWADLMKRVLAQAGVPA